jgi:hypothetical protein
MRILFRFSENEIFQLIHRDYDLMQENDLTINNQRLPRKEYLVRRHPARTRFFQKITVCGPVGVVFIIMEV